MGLSLKVSARFFSRDTFQVWDATTDSFTELPTIRGKRFRIDRFTPIYNRPTRRAFIRLFDPAYPGVGVIKRVGTEEIYLLSETLNTDIENGTLRYEDMRMSHLAVPPSGGQGIFTPATILGTGDDLGPVDLTTQTKAYCDFEFFSTVATPDTTTETGSSRFIMNHSMNISPQTGDLFTFNGRTFIITAPYVDGGLRAARVIELPNPYEIFSYKIRTGTGAYNPSTGKVTQTVTERLFSGIIGNTTKSTEQGAMNSAAAKTKLELYVYERHVGFEFVLGNQITHNGATYYVDSITRNREESQYKLVLSR